MQIFTTLLLVTLFYQAKCLFSERKAFQFSNAYVREKAAFSYKHYLFVVKKNEFQMVLVQIDTQSWQIVRQVENVAPFSGLVSGDYYYYTQAVGLHSYILGRLHLETLQVNTINLETEQIGEAVANSLVVQNNTLYFSYFAQDGNRYLGRMNSEWRFESVMPFWPLISPVLDDSTRQIYFFHRNESVCYFQRASFPDMSIQLHIPVPIIEFALNNLQLLQDGTLVGVMIVKNVTSGTSPLRFVKLNGTDGTIIAMSMIPFSFSYAYTNTHVYYEYKSVLYQVSLSSLQIVNSLNLNQNQALNILVPNNGVSVYINAITSSLKAAILAIDNRCNIGEYMAPNTSCYACEKGHVSASFNASGCVACEKGMYASVSHCIPCAPGYHSNSAASSSCVPCETGTYAPTSASHECLPCSSATTIASVTCNTDYSSMLVIFALLVLLVGIFLVAITVAGIIIVKRRAQATYVQQQDEL